MTSDVTVQIRAGEYAETVLAFTAADSGRDGYQVIWKNYPNEHALLHGGRRITGWTRDTGNVYKAPVDWTFHTLYENGVRAQKARHPNTTTGNAYAYNRTTGVAPGADRSKFIFGAGDLPALSDAAGLEVVLWPGGPEGIWNWVQPTFTVESIDGRTRTLSLGREICCGQSNQTPWPIGVGSRYFIQGARELLDQPGEFSLRDGFLYYWPRQMPIEEQSIIAPAPGSGNRLSVLIFGKPGEMASDIRFEGLSIAYTDRNVPGVFVSEARGIALAGNHVFDTGGTGIGVSGTPTKVAITGNLVHGVGGDGINVYGAADIGRPSDFTISSNHVHHTGELRGDSAGISVGSARNGAVSHNLIHDVPRAGLRAYGFANLDPPVFDATDLVFEYNDISRAVTDSQDSGLLHFSGVGPNVTIHNNRFHDSDMPFSYGEGIYLDVCNTRVVVSHNLVDGLQQRNAAAITYDGLQMSGNEIEVTNNVMAQNHVRRAEVDTNVTPCPGVPTRDVNVQRNILAANGADSIYSFPNFDEDQFRAVDFNLFFHPSGIYKAGFGYGNGVTSFSATTQSLDSWRSTHPLAYDRNSMVADPRFVDAAKRDFRLRPDSPAHQLGIREIDQAAIGLTADFPYAEPADPLARLFVGTAQSGPSATLRLVPLQTAQMAVTARTRSGYLVTPAATALSFASDKPEIAAVDARGEISAGRTGLATITVAAGQGEQQVSTLLFVDVAGAVSTMQTDCLFDWAENQYRAELWPAGARSGVFDSYYYRYYPGRDAYVGVATNDRHLYYLGPLSDRQLLDLGAASDWYAAAGCR